MTRIKSLAELPERFRTQGGVELVRKAKPRKYRNVPTIVDGQRFDSKLEARCYQRLMERTFAGEVLWFIRQPSFQCGGGVVYRADFLAVLATGGVEVIDATGMVTAVKRNKLKQIKARYGIDVQLWKGK